MKENAKFLSLKKFKSLIDLENIEIPEKGVISRSFSHCAAAYDFSTF
jgi:hypothetical protein